MDRTVFKLPFTATGATKYPCPTCAKGYLMISEHFFMEKETKDSIEGRKHDGDWDAERDGSIVYSGIFECSNIVCKDVVSSSGMGRIEEEFYYDEKGLTARDYVNYFMPVVFYPHLKPFYCPKNTPENVSKEIDKSFALIFIDPPSAANHIRVALEHLLTHLKIKRFTTKDKKKSFIPLHNRIMLLPHKYDSVKDIFLAIKWLGNAGSHSNKTVTLDDVLDSYELTIELLDEIFSKRRESANSMAKQINKKKGPK